MVEEVEKRKESLVEEEMRRMIEKVDGNVPVFVPFPLNWQVGQAAVHNWVVDGGLSSHCAYISI